MNSFEIICPDDWHVHLREGAALKDTVAATAAHFERAAVMPNLKSPVTTLEKAQAYRKAILQALPAGQRFTPLMLLYLCDETNTAMLKAAQDSGIVMGVKLYPQHATTNASHGVSDLAKMPNILAEMETLGLPLMIHGEVTDPNVDVFDRERFFIDRYLSQWARQFPNLKMILEHITTAEGVACVQAFPNLGGSITVHHLLFNRNALFTGGIRPHHYCLPVLKRENHRLALLNVALKADKQFFLGTDSAPHTVESKECSHGCAGIFSAPYAMPLLADLFEKNQALDKLEAFCSQNGAAFYGLPENKTKLQLFKATHTVPPTLSLGAHAVQPFFANETLAWQARKI